MLNSHGLPLAVRLATWRAAPIAVALVLALAQTSEADLYHVKEDCVVQFSAEFEDLLLECDECTGWGDATWYFKSHLMGSADTDCAGNSNWWDENVGINLNTGSSYNNPQNFDADMWTWGSETDDQTCDCEKGPTKRNVHFDTNVYNEYQTEKVGSAQVEEIWILKYGPAEVLQDDVDAGPYTFAISQTSSLSLGTNASFSAGLLESVEAAVGFTIEETYEETASVDTDRDFVQDDLGKYFGGFYYQTRIKQPIRYRHWTCTPVEDPPAWTDSHAYQGTSRFPRVRTASTQQAILDIQDNASLVSGSYIMEVD